MSNTYLNSAGDISKKNVSSLKDAYGELTALFLESQEAYYSEWDRAETPQNIWSKVQSLKENFLFLLLLNGLDFEEYAKNKDIDWSKLNEMMTCAELTREYPVTLPDMSEIYNLTNNFSPKWGNNTCKKYNKKIVSNVNNIENQDNITKSNKFEMDTKQWKYICYETILLCCYLIKYKIDELRYYRNKIEEEKIKKDIIERSCTRSNSNIIRRNIGTIRDNENEAVNFKKIRSKSRINQNYYLITKKYNEFNDMYKALLIFLDLARTRFEINQDIHNLLERFTIESDCYNMGSHIMINPLDIRFRISLLIGSWNIGDCEETKICTWNNGKLRIRPGGAPRIRPLSGESKRMIDNEEFKNWLFRQINLIYSNVAFKLQRILIFIPPGWIQYIPSDIDLLDMVKYRDKYWTSKIYNLNNNQHHLQFMNSNVIKYLGTNPQKIFEYCLESISILNNLRIKIERDEWGDLAYLKSKKNINKRNEKVGKELLIRLMKLMSAMERLDFAIRRDIVNYSITNNKLSSTFQLNFASICTLNNEVKDNGVIYEEYRYISKKSNNSLESDQNELMNYNENIDNIRSFKSIAKLSSYWMLEIPILHVIIYNLMNINTIDIDQKNSKSGIENCINFEYNDKNTNKGELNKDLNENDLTRYDGIHLYSPFITRCVLFISYLLQNGTIGDDLDIEYLNSLYSGLSYTNNEIDSENISTKVNYLTKTGVMPISIDTYALYCASNIWNNYYNSNYNKLNGRFIKKDFNQGLNNGIATSGHSNNNLKRIFQVIRLLLTNFTKFLEYPTIEGVLLECKPLLEASPLLSLQMPQLDLPFHVPQQNLITSKQLSRSSSHILKMNNQPLNSTVTSVISMNSFSMSEYSYSNLGFSGEKIKSESLLESQIDCNNLNISGTTNEDIINKFCQQKNSCYIIEKSTFWNMYLSRIKRTDTINLLWKDKDWLVSYDELSNTNIDLQDLWKIFGISLSSSSRYERLYTDIIMRRLYTLKFRIELLECCQDFFILGNSNILKELLYIIRKLNTYIILNNINPKKELSDNKMSQLYNKIKLSNNNKKIYGIESGLVGLNSFSSYKTYWNLYCSFCVSKSNELMIQKLFDIPMQMLKLPATHRNELKLRINKNNSEIEEEERIRLEKLAKEEIQSCIDTFISSFKYLDDIYILETITCWSKVWLDYGNISVKDYVKVIIEKLLIYIPNYIEELIKTEYWDLNIIPSKQFQEFLSYLFIIDKYIYILKNWLEFNLGADILFQDLQYINKDNIFKKFGIEPSYYIRKDSVADKDEAFNHLNQINYMNFSLNNTNENVSTTIKNFNKIPLTSNNLKYSHFLSIFITPSLIEMIQSKLSILLSLIQQAGNNNKDSLSTSLWVSGINIPSIYMSPIIIDIGTIINTGIDSILEWVKLPIEDSSMILLSPILSFFRDASNFVIKSLIEQNQYLELSDIKDYSIENLHYLSSNYKVGNYSFNNKHFSERRKLRIEYYNEKYTLNNNNNDNDNNNIMSPKSIDDLEINDLKNTALGSSLAMKFNKNGLLYQLLLNCIKLSTSGRNLDSNLISSNIYSLSPKQSTYNNGFKVQFVISIRVLVSLHTLFFFKNLLIDTSQKVRNIFFNKTNILNLSNLINTNFIENIRKILEYLRQYGAMDIDENKILSSNNEDLNTLILTGIDNDISNIYEYSNEEQKKSESENISLNLSGSNENIESKKSPSIANKKNSNPSDLESMLNNIINECVSNIDKLAFEIFDLFSISVLYGQMATEIFLDTYSEYPNIAGNSVSACIDNTTGLENLIPRIKREFDSFVAECPNNDEWKKKFNSIWLNNLYLSWLIHIVELSKQGLNSRRLTGSDILLFENDLESLDNLRRSYRISDIFDINNDDEILYSYKRDSSQLSDGNLKNSYIRLNDFILKFLTKLVKNPNMLHEYIREPKNEKMKSLNSSICSFSNVKKVSVIKAKTAVNVADRVVSNIVKGTTPTRIKNLISQSIYGR
ncbi:uncharacterized protein CMU_019110 [Cryptosporidium muris RN66]|uniref:Uncharacterized protein n=1 Tax=Cryptosporidium muris (strain RN66) TaxID=441375 RepID=B6AC98_CRYMR|nr:uncharacterized protein CMU_019110 [Cryptosporidium muris RN66]EEA06154.1 hypothetical protein, conserved [Cryptosporidium muris RN66]|eukprot:XP_002140503.1 hypothetical protein [Cryptosporidium muris RN66]